MTMDVTGINTSQKTVEKLLYSIERKKKVKLKFCQKQKYLWKAKVKFKLFQIYKNWENSFLADLCDRKKKS